MRGSHSLLLAAAALADIISGSAIEGDWVLALLKRQESGTPAYACHSACGTSITLSRGSDPCNDQSFLTNYADCLACAGPDKLNIWRYYGATLETAGTKCGLSTTPGSAAPVSGTSAGSSLSRTSTSPLTTTSTTSTIATPATSTTTASPVGTHPSVTTTIASTASTTSNVNPQTTSTSQIPIPTPISTGTRPAGNVTATTSSAQFTGAAYSKKVSHGGILGAAIIAFLF